MRQSEIEEEASERKRRVQEHPLFPHVMTLVAGLVVNIIIVAFVVGQVIQRIDQNSDDLAIIKLNASPAAAQAIASIRAIDESQNEQITILRSEMRDSRREMLDYLQRIDQKLDDHVRR